ncbi:hypothetical protein F5B20DRAFT_525200 [Whalleya microplaca]|nr:hypothetical protein F5B20DRAFT_525200 [Whalleya microplaca]
MWLVYVYLSAVRGAARVADVVWGKPQTGTDCLIIIQLVPPHLGTTGSAKEHRSGIARVDFHRLPGVSNVCFTCLSFWSA